MKTMSRIAMKMAIDSQRAKEIETRSVTERINQRAKEVKAPNRIEVGGQIAMEVGILKWLKQMFK